MGREIGPPMMLLSWDTIRRLGRIPHSAEGQAISLEQAATRAKQQQKRFFIEMFSHRWNTPFAPDDRWNSKARALVEWGKYRLSTGMLTFYWIDYACIDQGDIGPGVIMLPLYVSSCNNIICYETPSYEPRAWCRVERLMFNAFVAPNVEFINCDFTYDPQTSPLVEGMRELQPKAEEYILAPDPAGHHRALSYPSDSELIQKLRALCREHWGSCWKDILIDIVKKNSDKYR